MYKYQQLAAQIRPITEVDLILFKVSPEEKTHIVKQYNKALSNSKGDGTDVAQIFLKPLITEYPTWGEASLIYGLCLAYEGEYERAAGAVEYAIKNLPRGAFFADLCTGSGCIAISILAHRPKAYS